VTIAPKLELLASRHFTTWLAEQRISLAVTTYQSNKLFLLGLRPDGQLSGHERTFARCMGLWSNGQTIWLTSQYQIWRLENALRPGELADGFDRLYVPRVGYVTGDVDAHDIAPDAEGRPIFVNTLFGCLATLSERESFRPLWRPPFLSKLAAEDRCHLNGLAVSEGVPQYVTACGEADVVDGWRDQRTGGGCVIDVSRNQVVARGLSMPHSPRLAGERLWLLDSGTGHFGYLDLERGKFERVAFCPGYARGLALVGNYAVVGLSKPREQTFKGLPLDAELQQRGATSRCGLQVIDLNTGNVVHWLRIEGGVDELYDVVSLPGVARPKAFGFKTDEIRRNVWFSDEGQTTHWLAQDRS
jgi:uncharacterized protein (TIGR03032 family)